MSDGPSTSRPLPLRVLPHLFLTAILAIEVLLATGMHQGEDELRAQAEHGDTHERIWALHVLANRDPAGMGLDDDGIQELLNDDDPLVVDFAFTIDICRVARLLEREGRPPKRQEARSTRRFRVDDDRQRDSVADWWRRFVLYRRKVGGRTVGGTVRLRRPEIGWYFDALAGRELDEEMLIEVTNERQLKSYMVRQQRPPDEVDRTPPQAGLVPGYDDDDR